MASPQHIGSAVSWRVAIDEELLHLRHNLADASLAAHLFWLLDGPVTRPGVPSWMASLSPDLRSPRARWTRALATGVYAAAGAAAAGAAAVAVSAPAGARVLAATVTAAVLVAVLTLVVEIPLHRSRPVAPQSDAARYLTAEAVLAAREIAAGPAGPALEPAVRGMLGQILRSIESLDCGPRSAAHCSTPLAASSSRHSWVLEQVAALRVMARCARTVDPTHGAAAGPARSSDADVAHGTGS